MRPKEVDENGGKGTQEIGSRLGFGEGKYGDILLESLRVLVGFESEAAVLDRSRRLFGFGFLSSSSLILARLGVGHCGVEGKLDKGLDAVLEVCRCIGVDGRSWTVSSLLRSAPNSEDCASYGS